MAGRPSAGRDGGCNPARRLLEGCVYVYRSPGVQCCRASGTADAIGPGLLASPELVRWAAHHAVTQADLLSDHVVQSLLEESLDLMAPGAPRELLNTVVAVACRAQQTMARLLLRRLCGYDGEPEVRRADFLAAFVLLEEAAERSVGQYD